MQALSSGGHTHSPVGYTHTLSSRNLLCPSLFHPLFLHLSQFHYSASSKSHTHTFTPTHTHTQYIHTHSHNGQNTRKHTHTHTQTPTHTHTQWGISFCIRALPSLSCLLREEAQSQCLYGH